MKFVRQCRANIKHNRGLGHIRKLLIIYIPIGSVFWQLKNNHGDHRFYECISGSPDISEKTTAKTTKNLKTVFAVWVKRKIS